MNTTRFKELREAFINSAIEGSESGSWVWDGGAVESFLGRTLDDDEMEALDEFIASDPRIAYSEVCKGLDGVIVIDCNLYLDYLKLACRSAILFNNTMNGEKYYLQHADLEGDYQDEYTDKDLLEQAEKLMANNFDVSSIDVEFEIENISNAYGIRNVIKTIEMQ